MQNLTTPKPVLIPVLTVDAAAAQSVEAELLKLRAENAALQAAAKRKANPAEKGMKVSEKGAVSVYGLGRFPVTLYKQQWRKLAEIIFDVLAFIDEKEAAGLLKDKG